MPYSSIRKLDRTKARNYAVKWATTPPYCDSSRYIHIPTKYEKSFDCANFASQVLHEAGAPFTGTDISKRKLPNEWFAMNRGNNYSYAWASASMLKEFLIMNRKSYQKTGPQYWRGTWFDRGEDNTLYPGDLIFLCLTTGPNNGTAKHTLICSKEGGRNRALYCAHDSNEKDQPLWRKLNNNVYPRAVGLNIEYRY